MIWILIYVGILVLGILKVAMSKKTILIRGKTILVFNFVFTIFALLVSLISRSIPSEGLLIFFVIILVLPLLIKNKWILLRDDLLITAGVIEECLSMILIPFTKNAGGYDLNLADGKAEITSYGIMPGTGIIDFNGEWKQKKVEVLQALLKKNFGSIFPKIVIHLKNKNNVKSN
jgi:hypothetical protein